MTIDNRVQAVFDKAMYLIDAQSDSTGLTMTNHTKEYQVRTLGILNTLLDVVYPASTTFPTGWEATRPALPDLTGFDDQLDLDPRVLREILPCGLAARLLNEENPQLANYFQQCFEEGLADARARRPVSFESAWESSPYGGIEHGQFSMW